MVVEDAAKKQAIADVYRANFAEYRNMPRADVRRGRHPRRTPAARCADSAGYLAENFHRAPLMLIPCLWGRLDDASVGVGAR